MRFTVDGWDPGYGASLELEGQLEQSTATVEVDVELPASRWRPLGPAGSEPLPGALLFVDGVRRIEAHVWIDNQLAGEGPATAATEALCASYAAGVVCCCDQGAHLLVTELRRGLFSVAPHASDISTRAGDYKAHHVTSKAAGVPVMMALSQSLQRRLAEAEVIAAVNARTAAAGHAVTGTGDLLIVDGPLRGRQHLPRVLGYIKSHRTTYLPQELNAVVAALAPGQRTPAFLMGTTWDRHSWYLRLPGGPGSPWAGVVRLECPADLPAAEVTRLANLSQHCLVRFASAEYKDTRAPQNLYPIAGLERELRRRLGDPRLLYRALRQASHPDLQQSVPHNMH